MKKTCSKCKVEKPMEDFQKLARNKDGHTSQCKVCKREYDNTHYKNNQHRKEYITKNRKQARDETRIWLAQYLANHPCVDCGESDAVVLEFDHVDRSTKRDSISRLRNSSLLAVKNEVLKCEVRCANCHRKRTAKQFGWDVLKSVPR